MAALEYVDVTYKAIAAVPDTSVDEDFDPNIRPVTGNVDLVYRTPPGWTFKAEDYEPDPVGAPGVLDPTDLALQAFEVRLDEGQLLTLSGNPVRLVANTPLLGWPYGDLYIDVLFRNVVYNRGPQTVAPFAFVLPVTGGTTINLTTVDRHPWLAANKYGGHFARLTPSQ